MERIYNKLVRDNIPNIIRKNNETPIIRVKTIWRVQRGNRSKRKWKIRRVSRYDRGN